MCLGQDARDANKAAKQNYEHKLKVRERKWMNELALTNVERIQYDQTMDATHVGLGNAYAEIQEKYGDMIAKATQAQEDRFRQFAQEATSEKLAASGATGASIRRLRTTEMGQFLAQGSRDAYNLLQGRRELNKAGAKAAAATRQTQLEAFARNNVIKTPDLAPPPPVMQNVGAAAFKDALSIVSTVASVATGVGGLHAAFSKPPASDRRLKENIKKIGESISGLGIYKFNYIGQAKKYIGAMADEVIKIVPEAAILGDDGFYRVNYDLIDVTFKEA